MTNEERKIARTALNVIMGVIEEDADYSRPAHAPSVAAASGLINMLLDDKEEAWPSSDYAGGEEQLVASDELAELQNIATTARDFYDAYENGYKPNGKPLKAALNKLDAHYDTCVARKF
jgi:hypothetical protein